MPRFQPKLPVALPSGLNFLPRSAKFEGLAPSEGTEIVRIRFRLGDDKTLDILPMAEDLIQLADALSVFGGLGLAEVRKEAQRLEDAGDLLDP
jgi:hypothetical protein